MADVTSTNRGGMDGVIQLAQKYRQEFESNFDGLRKRSVELSENAQQQVQALQEKARDLQPTAQQKKEELVNIVQDMSPITNLNNQRMMETFAWTAVLQFAYSATSTLTGIMLAPLVAMLMDTTAALVLAYGALPYIAYKHVQQQGEDQQVRFKLLGFAVAEGVLVGYILSHRYLSTAGPLTFLTPLLIGLVAQLSENKFNQNRQTFLGATVGAGLAAHLVLGLIGGQLSFPYLVLALLYSAAGLVSVQYYLKYQTESDNAPTHLYQFAYFISVLAAQALVFALMGGAPKDDSSHSHVADSAHALYDKAAAAVHSKK